VCRDLRSGAGYTLDQYRTLMRSHIRRIERCHVRVPDAATGSAQNRVRNARVIRPRGVASNGSHVSLSQHRLSILPGRVTNACCDVRVVAPCKGRPRKINDAIVRYHRQEHGASAVYECEFGFRMIGDNHTLCLYGQWQNTTAQRTKCVPS